ncbi:MAG TPA: cytochrome c peroxidase [Steroidobacteraceae bacterium]
MRAQPAALLLWWVVLAGWRACPAGELTPLSELAQLGRQEFFDPSLSASGRLACASCHSPARAYASPAGGAAPPAGERLDRMALRMVPSLRYLAHTPRFTRHFYTGHGEDNEDSGPAGGFMRDGRADSLHEQALLPWLDRDEMANQSIAALAQRLSRADYASRLRSQFGRELFDRPRQSVAAAALAVERFELEDPSFHPYSSRYDRFLAGELTLSAQEQRGLELFLDPHKGDCAECHPATRGPGGRGPVFTDYSYRALGVPRNPELAANENPGFYDLGLCGPLRANLAAETRYCGYFKTPTLRNSARRTRFFHNGRFRTLQEVLEFYAQRDTAPQRFYPLVAGRLRRFDDLPARYRNNVDRSDPPFGRTAGDSPALNSAEIADLAAFLVTLDDAD